MGKGKGSFDYWAARVAVSQIVFEIRGDCHEQVVKDAMRLAGNKLPGESYTFGCQNGGEHYEPRLRIFQELKYTDT